jgi:hypothetical protein
VISGVSLLRRFNIPRAPRTALIVALTVEAVLPPTVTAIGYVRMIGKVSTQAEAYRWLSQHVPDGARVIVERSEVRLPEPRFRVKYTARLTDRAFEDYRKDGVEYLVSTSQVTGPIMANPAAFRDLYDRHMTMMMMGREVARFTPTPERPGPELVVIAVQ